MLQTWFDAAVLPRIRIARLLPTGGPWLVMDLLVINLLLGLAPVGFVIGTSVVVGRVPAAVVEGAGGAAWDEVVIVFVLTAAVFCLQQVLAPLQTAIGSALERRVDGRLRDRFVASALSSTGIGPMEDQRTLDALSEATRQMDASFQTPGAACSGLLALVARYARLVGFVTIVGLVASWWAAAALALATMVFRYGQRGGLRRYSTAWSSVVGHRRRAEYLREVGMGPAAAKELRVFGLTGWFGDRYEEATLEMLAPVTARRRTIYLRPYLVYTAIGLAVGAVVVVVLARGAAAGDIGLTGLTLGLQSVVAALLLGEYYPESDVATQYGMQSLTAFADFEGLVAASAAGGLAPGAQPVPPDSPTRSITFEGVTFAYPGSSRPVLDGLDLELAAGRCTAVVGVNGAGKTTLVKLLTRLYEPTSGRITSDGTDIADLDVAGWRRQVSVIFQDFVRYELSAADNIALGAVHAARTTERVRAAAEAAGVLDVLDGLPSGLESPLSRAFEGGADLSGGQWQRVAIARSLYALGSGARVLVLDEPTSALDVRAEAAFFDAFVDLTRGATSLLISHRFSSVRRADHIVVLDEGRLVEQGSHDELMRLDGHYARLFHLQAERFDDVETVPESDSPVAARTAEGAS